MRSAPALVVILLVIAPVVLPLDAATPAAGAREIHLPFAVQDLRLSTVAWKFPLREFVKDAQIACCRAEGPDLFLLDTKNTVHCVEIEPRERWEELLTAVRR